MKIVIGNYPDPDDSRNLILNEEDVAGKMATGPDFNLDLTSHTLTINMSDGTVVEYKDTETEKAEEALYNLLRYGTLERN